MSPQQVLALLGLIAMLTLERDQARTQAAQLAAQLAEAKASAVEADASPA